MSGRIRTIKPELLEDEKTGRLDDSAWRLFVSLFLLADDHGRFRADPDLLSGQVFWHSRKPSRILASLLGNLATGKLVTVYRVRDQLYGQIDGWTKHQRVDKPSKPRVPALADGEVVDLSEETKKPSETLASFREEFAKPRGNLAPDPDLRPPILDPETEHNQLASLVGTQAELLPVSLEGKTKQPPEVFQVRDAFCAGYRELYNGADYEWDHARDGKQAKALLKKAPGGIDQLLVEIDAYFGWRDPLVIDDGHTFSHGRASFITQRRRLQADMAAPERHRAAAVVRQERYHEGKDAYVKKLGQ